MSQRLVRVNLVNIGMIQLLKNANDQKNFVGHVGWTQECVLVYASHVEITELYIFFSVYHATIGMDMFSENSGSC